MTNDRLYQLLREVLPTMTIKRTPTVHTCSCGQTYARSGWDALKYVGLLDKDDEGDKLMEMRNCAKCGSTRAADRVLPANK